MNFEIDEKTGIVVKVIRIGLTYNGSIIIDPTSTINIVDMCIMKHVVIPTKQSSGEVKN